MMRTLAHQRGLEADAVIDDWADAVALIDASTRATVTLAVVTVWGSALWAEFGQDSAQVWRGVFRPDNPFRRDLSYDTGAVVAIRPRSIVFRLSDGEHRLTLRRHIMRALVRALVERRRSCER